MKDFNYIDTYFNCSYEDLVTILRLLRIREVKPQIKYPCYDQKMEYRISPTMIMPMLGGEETVLIRVIFSAN